MFCQVAGFVAVVSEVVTGVSSPAHSSFSLVILNWLDESLSQWHIASAHGLGLWPAGL